VKGVTIGPAATHVDFQGDIMLPNHLASIARLTREHGDVRKTSEGHFYESDIATYSAWKIPLLQRVLARPFAGKRSTPYGIDTVHDFMHAKVCVCDDTTFVGSFNLSRSGEKNAENVLEIEDPGIADKLATFVDEVRARYPRVTIAASGSGPPAPAAAP